MNDSILIPLADAVQRTGISRDKLLQYIRATDDTHLPAKKIGGKYYLKPSVVERWFDSFPDA